MTPLRLAVAGRYPERHTIKKVLAEAKLDALPVVITASWLDCTEEGDADLTDEQAWFQVETNTREILNASLLLYVPSYWPDDYCFYHPDTPRWSPGRMIDVGIALGNSIPVLIVGKPENSIYFRGMPWCTPETLRETVERVLNSESDHGAANIEGWILSPGISSSISATERTSHTSKRRPL